MAEYHVRFIPEKEQILAGPVNKDGKFSHSSVVSDEAADAVKEFLLHLTKKNDKDVSRYWDLGNGKALLLKLDIINMEEVKKQQEE